MRIAILSHDRADTGIGGILGFIIFLVALSLDREDVETTKRWNSYDLRRASSFNMRSEMKIDRFKKKGCHRVPRAGGRVAQHKLLLVRSVYDRIVLLN